MAGEFEKLINSCENLALQNSFSFERNENGMEGKFEALRTIFHLMDILVLMNRIISRTKKSMPVSNSHMITLAELHFGIESVSPIVALSMFLQIQVKRHMFSIYLLMTFSFFG